MTFRATAQTTVLKHAFVPTVAIDYFVETVITSSWHDYFELVTINFIAFYNPRMYNSYTEVKTCCSWRELLKYPPMMIPKASDLFLSGFRLRRSILGVCGPGLKVSALDTPPSFQLCHSRRLCRSIRMHARIGDIEDASSSMWRSRLQPNPTE